MLDPKKINDLINEFTSAMPEGIRKLPEEMKKNMHSALQATFAKLDLVTREEFDAQAGILLRLRARIAELEHKLKQFEQSQHGTNK